MDFVPRKTAMSMLLLSMVASTVWPAIQTSDSILIRNALIVDGTGRPPFSGEVLVTGGRIIRVVPPDVIRIGAEVKIVDLGGDVLAPGFIDIHNHSTGRLARDPYAITQIAQGVTTIIVGADGSSPWPIGEYLDRIMEIEPAVNVGVMVGHGTVRRAVLGDNYRREATEDEIGRMAERINRGMEEGAFGISTGLEYDPGFYSTTEELITLARITAEHGGFYMSHVRDEEEGVMGSIDEAIRIGREAMLPVQISHIKMGNASVWGRAGEALEKIRVAREEGLDVSADQYPYQAWQSSLAVVVQSRRFSDREAVSAGLAALGGAERLQIVNYPPDRSVEGMRLSEIAIRDRKSSVELYIEMMRNGGAGIIGHTMREDDVVAFMASPYVLTSSDGGVGSAHPRGAGTFARLLGRYVRELQLLPLERAVQKATSMPARRLRLRHRGRIREGAIADLVAFNPAKILDRSTFTEPLEQAEGISHTWVMGKLVWENGTQTGQRPGQALKRPERLLR